MDGKKRDAMVTLPISRQDADALIRIADDLLFIRKAEEGEKQIEKGRFLTLSQLRQRCSSGSE